MKLISICVFERAVIAELYLGNRVDLRRRHRFSVDSWQD